ncbi:MAG: amino acid permease, partial [Saprospiraceae bacterium]|nr:amino acid permease [Saprospiraceae bacterium]
IVLIKGADLGVKTLYVVVTTLFLSLVAFFLGTTDYAQEHTGIDPFAHVETYDPAAGDTSSSLVDSLPAEGETADGGDPSRDEEDSGSGVPINFFTVFAIIFPAFTGMTAGVGLSGDLAKPSRSIPLGTMAGTLTGMVVYFFIAWKLAASASPESLADTENLVMAEIAWQGWWIIPLGLAAATISSGLGSLMVAPRTLQAIARDRVLPSRGINFWLSRGRGKSDEPYNATIATIAMAFVFVMIGGVDFVAEIISMFFMVTYGTLCLISFLQHFAADPSYRPTFRSRWYISLFGALGCFALMFFMNAIYAVLAILMMVLFYNVIAYYNPEKKNLAVIFQGVIFQLSRQFQVFMQKVEKEKTASWRPSVICISEDSFDRLAAFDLLRWVSQRYGFGTYIHKIDGYLSKSTHRQASEAKERLIKMAEASKSNVYIDTLISPSYTSAIAQVIQLPGISGSENNFLFLEFSKHNPDNLADIVDNFKLIKSVDFDLAILGSSERGFALKRSIHIWITSNDYENANLMILLAYVIMGHREWSDGHIKIFAVYPEETCMQEFERLAILIEAGQLPISKQNIEIIPSKPDVDSRKIISEKSKDADLTIVGVREELIRHGGTEVFKGYEGIGNTLFINSSEQKEIK